MNDHCNPCRLETPKQVLFQTVKTQMKCCRKQDKCVIGGDEIGNDVDLIKPWPGLPLFALAYMSNMVRHVRIQTGSGPPLKNHKNKGFLSNSGPDLLKNYEATKPAFNVGPFKWRFAGWR